MRWTVRGIEPDMVRMVREVAALNGLTIGQCMNEAIQEWYDCIPEDGDDDDDDDGDGIQADSLEQILSYWRQLDEN